MYWGEKEMPDQSLGRVNPGDLLSHSRSAFGSLVPNEKTVEHKWQVETLNLWSWSLHPQATCLSFPEWEAWVYTALNKKIKNKPCYIWIEGWINSQPSSRTMNKSITTTEATLNRFTINEILISCRLLKHIDTHWNYFCKQLWPVVSCTD